MLVGLSIFFALPEPLQLPLACLLAGIMFFVQLKGKVFTAPDLETQLRALADLGIRLDEGVGLKELQLSFSRADYKNRPYTCLLVAMGSPIEREPWTERTSSDVWNFDNECIEDKKVYAGIVKNLVRLAKLENKLDAVLSDVDFEAQSASLIYKIGDIRRKLEPVFEGDWADQKTVHAVMSDIEQVAGNEKYFWCVDNGQAWAILFISDQTAKALNKLARRLVSRCVLD